MILYLKLNLKKEATHRVGNVGIPLNPGLPISDLLDFYRSN
jgi:hypothetical protein